VARSHHDFAGSSPEIAVGIVARLLRFEPTILPSLPVPPLVADSAWSRVQALSAVTLAAAIFSVDAFSSFTLAIAVLYRLAVLIAPPRLISAGVVAAFAACVGLTVAGDVAR